MIRDRDSIVFSFEPSHTLVRLRWLLVLNSLTMNLNYNIGGVIVHIDCYCMLELDSLRNGISDIATTR